MILEKTLNNLRKSKHGFFNIKNGDFVDFETLKSNIRFTDVINNEINNELFFRKEEISEHWHTNSFKFYKGREIFYLTDIGSLGIYFI